MYFAGLTFGHGLGDLFYVYLQIVWIIILSIILTVIRKRGKEVGIILTAFIMVILFSSIIYITYEFTINRGVEYPWNGRIF
jgi:hypothetical protein